MKIQKNSLPILLVIIALIFRFATEGTANLSYLLVAVYALTGRSAAIYALLISWFFTMLNPGIAPEATGATAMRYVVMLASFVSIMFRIQLFTMLRLIGYPVYSLFLLFVFILIHSVFFSPFPDVSIIKATSWMIVMVTVILGWYGFNKSEHASLVRLIFNSMALVAIFSLPLLFMGQGYLRNEVGFQGILNHPQNLGSFSAIYGGWIAARFITGEKLGSWFKFLLVLMVFYVVSSEARSAFFALFFGLFIAILINLVLERNVNKKIRILPKSILGYSSFIIVVMSIFILSPLIIERVDNVISKSGRSEAVGLIGAYEGSRGFLIDRMMANIDSDPYGGVGFGIASESSSMTVDRDPFFGLPLGAAIEKGIMPLAVLEEIGIFGFIVFLIWLIVTIIKASFAGFSPSVVLYIILLLNLGENTFFSPGGMGLFSLVLIGWVISVSKHRVQ